MKRSLLGLSCVAFAVLVALFLLPLTLGSVELPPEQGGLAAADTQPDIGTVEPATCDYCGQNRCGCASPSAGCTLSASCTCGGGACTVTCSFQCE